MMHRTVKLIYYTRLSHQRNPQAGDYCVQFKPDPGEKLKTEVIYTGYTQLRGRIEQA